MEIIEVQAKSYLIHWREVPAGSDVKWQVRPLKKSVNFGLYRHKIDPTHVENSLADKSNSEPLAKRLANQGFDALTELERLPGNETTDGGCTASDDGMLAFVFDNTFSKSTPKTIEFWLSCTDANGKEALSLLPTASAASSSSSASNASSVSSASTAPTEASADSTNTKRNVSSTSVASTDSHAGSIKDEDSGIRRSPDRRYITGILLKKRRKKMQGFARRFFRLDTRLGQLHYYINPGSSYLRGVMPIRICELQTNQQTREITLSSGLERWSLKALSTADYQGWLSAFEECMNPSVSHVVGRQGQALSPVGAHSRQSSVSVNTMGATDEKAGQIEEALSEEEDKPNALEAEEIASLVQRLGDISNKLPPDARNSLRDVLKDFDVMLTPHGHSVSFSSRVKQKRPHIREKRERVHRLVFNVMLAVAFTPLVGVALGLGLGSILLLVATTVAIAVGGTALTFPKIEDIQETYEDIVSGLPIDDYYYDEEYSSDGGESDSEEEEQDEKAGAEDAKAQAMEQAKLAASRESTPASEAIPQLQLPQDPDVAAASSQLAAAAASAALYGAHSRQPSVALSTKTQPEEEGLPPLPHSLIKRRSDVPKPNHTPPSLISMIRRSAGKDLSSMTAPVTSNEPLSVLQRLCEHLEYSQLLDKASDAAGDQRLMYVALFALSALSAARVKERSLRKPFNSLLAETYECVREDKDFRFVAEKVSHRPPVFATQAESPKWTFHWTSRPHQKIWGKSAELTDSGACLVSFKDGEVINFMMPDCFLRNLVAGEKYLEPVGSVTVESSTSKSVTITFKAGGMFSGRSEEVEVRSGDTLLAEGTWTQSMHTPSGTELWHVGPLVENAKQKYGWTKFTASLNEITVLEEGMLPPNDSRNRPDQRFYEQGKVDQAEKLKLELEEHQRQRRKEYEDSGKSQEPMFFTKSKNSLGYFQLKAGDRNYWKMRQSKSWEGIPNYLK